MNLRTQLEGNSFAELVMRNTDAHTAEGRPVRDGRLQVRARQPGHRRPRSGQITGPAPSRTTRRPSATRTPCCIRMPNGQIRYRAINSVDPPGINAQCVYNGTAGVDRIYGGNDNDTFLGNEGNDIIEGGGGDDVALGGDGNDIITDLAGDDVPKGGPGNDAIDGGTGRRHHHGWRRQRLHQRWSQHQRDLRRSRQRLRHRRSGPRRRLRRQRRRLDEGGDQPDLLHRRQLGASFFDDHATRPATTS